MGFISNFARKNYFSIPPISLGILAELTPPSWDVKIIQEPQHQIDFDEQADLVGITAVTNTVKRGYQIADQFRIRGVKVIMGGIHPTARTEEALCHCDSVCIGEAELIWNDVLMDLKNKRLKKRYKADRLFDLHSYASPRRNLMTISDSFFFSAETIESSRGCAFNCDFCSVSLTHGNKVRYRHHENVAEEISKIQRKRLFFVDNNIAANQEKAKELFKSLIPFKKKWTGQASISITEDLELLKYAADSGCYGLLVGIESITDVGLKKYKKSKNDFTSLKTSVKILRDHGIAVLAHMVFGNDFDTKDLMVETLERLYELDIASATLGILVPYPGTKLAENLEKQERILTKDWDLYDINHLVFKPQNFSCEEFVEQVQHIRHEFFSFNKMLSRAINYRNPTVFGFNLSLRSHNPVSIVV